MNPPNHELLTIADIAELVGASAETIRGYHKTKNRSRYNFPPADSYFGRTPVWRRETVETWYSNRKSTQAQLARQ